LKSPEKRYGYWGWEKIENTEKIKK
jgi:hypothetical protein